MALTPKNGLAQMQAHFDRLKQESHGYSEEPECLPSALEERQEIDKILSNITEELHCTLALLAELDERRNKLSPTVSLDGLYQEFWEGYVIHVHNLEKLLWGLSDASWINRRDALHRLTQNKALLADQFDVQVDGELVLLKMPHLSQKIFLRFHLVEDLLLAKLGDTKRLPRMKECHATFIHVYPSGNQALAKDVDNYDYKRVIDLLAAFMDFSDSAATFEMTMKTVFSDGLQEGTYIVLEPQKSDFFSEKFLMQKFPKKLEVD